MTVVERRSEGAHSHEDYIPRNLYPSRAKLISITCVKSYAIGQRARCKLLQTLQLLVKCLFGREGKGTPDIVVEMAARLQDTYSLVKSDRVILHSPWHLDAGMI